jgi:RHS repeat-associated protein
MPAALSYGGGYGIDGANTSGYVAEPVDTATGAYSTTETDATLASAGQQFTLARSYTSNDPYSGPLGLGWTDSLNAFATLNADGSVSVTGGTGQVTAYTPNGDGTYTPALGVHSKLIDQPGGGWRLTRTDQEQLTFDSAGHLITWVDRNGVGLTLSYNVAGELASVTDYAGHIATFAYTGAGLLAKVSFPPNRAVTYTYTASNQLSSVTDSAGGVTSYTYDSAGYLATITDADGHVAVDNVYDDSSGRVTSQTNARGSTTSFSWDPNSQICTYVTGNGGQRQDVYSGNVLTERIDALGDVTAYAYDANGDKTAITDPDGNTTLMSYDAIGNMTTRTAPAPVSATETWTYDGMNDVTTHTDPDGNVTSYSYDSRGNLTQTSLPDGSTISATFSLTTGEVTSDTDPRGKTTTYVYDGSGQLTSSTDPAGNATTYGYDSAGRPTTRTDPSGKTTTTAYDALDRVTSVTDPAGHSTTYTYDAYGNKTAVSDGKGNKTRYTYDADNELTKVTAADGSVTTYTYDADGNKTSVTNGDGNTTTYGYDAADRLKTSTNPLGNVTSYGYDAAGNRTTMKDAVGASTTYSYDVADRLVKVSYSDSTPSVTYTYDAAGNRTKMADGAGTTTYAYGVRNELKSVHSPEGNFGYVYDADGNVTGRTTPDGVTATTTYTSTGLASTLAVDGGTTSYSYDVDSRLTSAALPNGVAETRTYDSASRLTSVSDQIGSTGISSYGYSYDAADNPTVVTVNGQADSYTYDARNQLTSVSYGPSGSSGSIAWTYDAVGNRLTQARTTPATTSTTYAYNTADQMTSSTTSSASTNRTYDADGRLTTAGTSSYTYNAANEMVSATVAGSTYTYTYTGDGLRATSAVGGVTTTYAYDINYSIPQLSFQSNTSASFRYTWTSGLLHSVRTGGHDYYIGHDALGSVVDVTDGVGTVDTTTTYEPYGAIHSTTTTVGAPTIPLGWEAENQDATGLLQLQARYLDASTGSFTEADSVLAAAVLPAVSSYLYANNQPTVLIDPTGRSWIDALGGGVSGAASWVGDSVGKYAHKGLGALGGAVASGVQLGVDGANTWETCSGNWSSVACGQAIQKTGVDAAETLVGLVCPASLVLVVACNAAVAAGGQWALDHWGIKTPGTEGDTRSGGGGGCGW